MRFSSSLRRFIIVTASNYARVSREVSTETNDNTLGSTTQLIIRRLTKAAASEEIFVLLPPPPLPSSALLSQFFHSCHSAECMWGSFFPLFIKKNLRHTVKWKIIKIIKRNNGFVERRKRQRKRRGKCFGEIGEIDIIMRVGKGNEEISSDALKLRQNSEELWAAVVSGGRRQNLTIPLRALQDAIMEIVSFAQTTHCAR